MKNTAIDSLVSATPFTKRFNLCMISDSDSRADSYELVRLSSTTVSTCLIIIKLHLFGGLVVSFLR